MSTAQEAEEEHIAVLDVAASTSQEPIETKSSTPAAINPETTKEIINNQDSIISLDYLNMGGNSSTMVTDNDETSTQSNEQNLRVEIFKPIIPEIEVTIGEPKCELLAPATHRAIIQEPKVELLPPEVHVAVVKAPKIELVSPLKHCAVIEEPKVGFLKTSDGDEIIILSDEEEGNRASHEIYESADDIDEGDQIDDAIVLAAVDSRCCARIVRERETQTPKNRSKRHPRSRVCLTVGTSSNNDNSEQQVQQKLKVNNQAQNNFKQRQLELHRHRICVEQKRLELLELKLVRERDEMIRDTILFEKELELKTAQIQKLTDYSVDV